MSDQNNLPGEDYQSQPPEPVNPRGKMPASWRDDFKSGSEPGDCPQCKPFACDDPDNHLGVPSEYTPLRNRGCRCGADAGGWDCMCFEDY